MVTQGKPQARRCAQAQTEGTHIVHVGELDLQGCEQGARGWLHRHRDDLGVQDGGVPGECQQATSGTRRPPLLQAQAHLWTPFLNTHRHPCTPVASPRSPMVPTSAGPGSCPGSGRARCPPQTQTSHPPLQESVPVTLPTAPSLGPVSPGGGSGSVVISTPTMDAAWQLECWGDCLGFPK